MSWLKISVHLLRVVLATRELWHKGIPVVFTKMLCEV